MKTQLRGINTFSGEATLSLLFCLPSEKGSTLKERMCFQSIMCRTGSHKSCFPGKKMAENLPSISSPLKFVVNSLHAG